MSAIRWTRKTGPLTSVDGRFLIRADYCGTTKPVMYTLMDSKGPSVSSDTQRQAKADAEQRIAAERTNGGGR